MSNLKKISNVIIFFSFLHKKWIITYLRCIEINIKVSVCLLGCNVKFTGTLIFISAVTGTGALATALKKTWRNNISFKKETENIVLLQVKGLIQIIVKFRTEKNICACFYHRHQTQTSWMWWGTHKILCTKYCVAVTLKRKELTVYISLKESKLACFTNS